MAQRATRRGFRRAFMAVALLAALAIVAAACGGDDSSGSSNTTKPSSGSTPQDTSLGTGVTPTAIKVGVGMIDYNCIKQFIDFNRGNQQQTYQAFIDNVNKTGINGRKVQAVYKSFCPIGTEGASSVCTQFTEDDKVFAVLGVIYDSTGAAQVCITKQHNTILISHELDQSLIDKAPPALMLSPDITAERRMSVVMELLKRQGTLKGKKVGILAETSTQSRINSAIKPGIQSAGGSIGTVGVLATGSNPDTTAAQAQLASFLEHWKSEKVDAIVISGLDTVSKNFVEQIKRELPDVLLITDGASSAKEQAQDEVKAGKKTNNPYEGMLTADAYDDQKNFETPGVQQCVKTYETITGQKVIAPVDVKPGKDGHRAEVFQSVEDVCSELDFFQLIATQTGKYLNNTNWHTTVDSLGSLNGKIRPTLYGSLKKGKYDADNTFALVSFDSSVGDSGGWKLLTPVQDVSG